ncbi:vitamin B12 dependent-methionine synthase activation domain-containing protein [Serpentinicella sp. ANB-PHB4]|uniref:vitamin B12 dependent-methionine synthase activation domain-containing protein n=1 Tax=Serpentinicella sp. ANB-PHB4 TaxID=3074076 RepID=UPI0028663043|nr:vitamin B12 dependent-methionine synthase activation domain-containing protein [Serpentinicella sp. ANB-PHB4]MDR5660066.1 vitamin B12 dependent-methionine synthase activation domain-containing protein [Serpentinicella sp. ANB-PHB4]
MIHNIDIQHLEKEKILRHLGYQKGKTELTEKMSQLIEDCIDEAKRLINPVGIYQTFEIKQINKEKIYLADVDYQIKSADIEQLLDGSRYTTFIAVTIGQQLDNHIDKLNEKGEYTRGLIMDAIGSEAAEESINKLNQIVEQEALQNGYRLTRRFSPGYGDFTITNQNSILDLLNTKEIDLRITDSSILIPRKSVTALVGWTKKNNTNRKDKCSYCNLEHCSYREGANYK